MKNLSLIIKLLIIGIAMMSDIQAATDTSEYKKPYYTVQISYAGTGAEFRLNDIPFYLENYSGQVDTEIPVSDKMLKGVNELSIIAIPYSEGKGSLQNWESKDAWVEASLYVREKDVPDSARQLLTHIKLCPMCKPDLAVAESIVMIEQQSPVVDYESQPRQFPGIIFHKQIVVSRKTHPITPPFPRWEWQDGQLIEDTKENYKSLLESYRNEYVIHQKQDLFALKQSTRKLAEVQMLVNYYDDIEKAYDTLNLEESWRNKDQDLFEFIENEKSKKLHLKLDIFANGKLARIVSNTGTQPIMYIVNKARITIKYKFSFYKNKQGEWVYIM